MDSGDSRREAGIVALVARFVDAVNRNDPEAFGRLWAPACRWELPGHPLADGRDAAVALFEQVAAAREFQFQLQVNGVIDLRGWPVCGRWHVQEVARRRDGQGERILARYHDTYEEGPEGWWFTERRLEVLYREEAPLPGTYHGG